MLHLPLFNGPQLKLLVAHAKEADIQAQTNFLQHGIFKGPRLKRLVPHGYPIRSFFLSSSSFKGTSLSFNILVFKQIKPHLQSDGIDNLYSLRCVLFWAHWPDLLLSVSISKILIELNSLFIYHLCLDFRTKHKGEYITCVIFIFFYL